MLLNILDILVALILGTTTPAIVNQLSTNDLVIDNKVVNTTDEPEKPVLTIEERIRLEAKEHVVNPDLASKIAKCESGHRQFNEDGSVLRGKVNSKDVGIFQINEFYHLEDSKRLGFDIYTENGNIGYGIWLMSQQGSVPWNWSKGCWGK